MGFFFLRPFVKITVTAPIEAITSPAVATGNFKATPAMDNDAPASIKNQERVSKKAPL